MPQVRSVDVLNSALYIFTSPLTADSARSSRKRSANEGGSRGKGGKSTLTGPPISESALATYRAVQQRLGAQERHSKEINNAAIVSRNKELLDADASGSGTEEDDGSRPSKRNKLSACPRHVLSDDEEEMALGLGLVRAGTEGCQARDGDGTDDENAHGVNNGEMDLEPELNDLSNELLINNDAEDGFNAFQNTCSRPTTTKPSHPRTSTTSHASNASKVVEKDFTPRSLKLALASKSHIRMRTVFDEPFPRNNKISRIDFAWKTIRESAVTSDDAEIHQAYKRAAEDLDSKSKLMKFTLYGRTGLMSSIISKARDKVRAYYGLSGEPGLVREDVGWLLAKSHFAYGGIDLRARTVDRMKPFGAQIIIDIIENQWFPSTSRSKLDLETTNKMYEKRDLPLNVILLVVTSIEHALKEWSSTGRKACQITFSEDTARSSFERHHQSWNYFESQMKAWPAWWRKTILEQIVANHSNFDLDDEDNDFAELDFLELDRLAGYKEDGIMDPEAGVEPEGGDRADA